MSFFGYSVYTHTTTVA